ncbi:MAG: cbb3-type cytochrome oxidase subunit 3 [Acidiferrobacterales bacterium]
MDIITFHIYWTVLMFLVFIGIMVWAWSARRRKSFTEAASMALEDEDERLSISAIQSHPGDRSGEMHHG